MSDIRVASRYAKSLLELAEEKGILEQVHQDMVLFSKTTEESRDFKLLLRNPIIKHDKKLSILNSIFKGKVTDMTLAFFSIITRKNREAVLDQVALEFEKQYNLKKGIQQVSVVSATPLTGDLRKELSDLVARQTGKTIQLLETIDQNLIGGFVLRVGDNMIDSSVRTTLRRLKNNFNDNTYISKI
jgi:F-type H+-transporting ATPase subunit delta